MNEEEITRYIDRYEKAISTLRRTLWTELMDFKEFGLTAPQFSMLKLLDKLGPSKVTDLAERFEVKPSAISVMIDRLVAGGFVERHNDEQDRRIVRVSISESGLEIIRKAMEKAKNVLTKYLSLLDEGDLKLFVEVNEKLADIVQQMKNK